MQLQARQNWQRQNRKAKKYLALKKQLAPKENGWHQKSQMALRRDQLPQKTAVTESKTWIREVGRGVNADDGCDQGDRCEEDQQEPDQWTFSGRILFACCHNSVMPGFIRRKKGWYINSLIYL